MELLSLTPDALAEVLGSMERAGRVFRSLRHNRDPFQDPDLGESLKRRLEKDCSGPTLLLEESAQKGDTEKLLFRLSDGNHIEAVLLFTDRRTTLCLSTQVGCSRGCVFCHTGRMGLIRNLTCEEIVSQVVLAQRTAPKVPIRNVVFMGMGEPLDNLEAVRQSLKILADNKGLGFAPRHITLSTIGTSPQQIRSLSSLPVQVAWSLHTANDEERKRLIPRGSNHTVVDLRDAFESVCVQRKVPLFVEITLIHGVNDSVSHATSIARCFEGFTTEVRFNLLPHNDGSVSNDRIQRFRDELRRAGYFSMVRRSRGRSNNAACGQLATNRQTIPR